MVQVTSPSEKFPPVGQCIYRAPGDVVDAHAGKLTEEHILPLGLSGNWVLPESSCEACVKVTGKFEQDVLRKMLGSVRAGEQFKTRRPKDRSRLEPVMLTMPDGRQVKKMVPLDEHPSHFLLPWLPPPQILFGQPPNPKVFAGDILVQNTEGVKAFLHRFGATSMRARGVHINSLARMLAKIAHSYAVARCGLDGFQPLLLDTIFKRSVSPAYVVGGDFHESKPHVPWHTPYDPAKIEVFHEISLRKIRMLGVDYTRIGLPPDVLFLVAHIRLFAYLGGPLYVIAAGIVPDESAHSVSGLISPTAHAVGTKLHHPACGAQKTRPPREGRAGAEFREETPKGHLAKPPEDPARLASAPASRPAVISGSVRPACQSARERNPGSASKRDPFVVVDWHERASRSDRKSLTQRRARSIRLAGGVDQARFLKRQDSLPVSTISQ
jgi:hypothetical protein